MIVTDRSRIVAAEPYGRGLVRSLRHVVRILNDADSNQATGTGWLITPRLVVVPAYLVKDFESQSDIPQVAVQGTKGGKVAWRATLGEKIEVLGSGTLNSVALLTLRRVHSKTAVTLKDASPQSGALLSMLSYPRGGTVLGLSTGTVLTVDNESMTYDADSEAGSGGGPLFNARWQLIGVHMGSDAQGQRNQGLSRAGLLRLLRESKNWKAIAGFHRLVDFDIVPDLGPVEPPPADPTNHALRLRAALTLQIPRARLKPHEQLLLKPLVINETAPIWTLQAAWRREFLCSAGSIEVLRKHAPRGRPTHPGQQVIARILAGPDYGIESATEEQLAWWLQATRWFEGIAPQLPSADTVNRVLQQKRARGRLDRTAGHDFTGRKLELGQLKRWFKSEPATALSLSGVGGVGKSALVAHFARQLPQETLLLWLDFDLATLAPDDAASVIDALREQAQQQIGATLPARASDQTWQVAAAKLAAALAKSLARSRQAASSAPLLVLDSFEVAQYAQRYQELWPVLEVVARYIPGMRLIVSGRAPVTSLRWRGQSATSLHLGGLKKPDAMTWLANAGIRGTKSREVVWRLSKGLPLILKLAKRYRDEGGSLARLPTNLPERIRAGFLYERILDRVYDPALKPLALGVLALRRVTETMLDPVFHGLRVHGAKSTTHSLLPPGTPAEWFEQLRREAAFFEGNETLHVRPELRAAALEVIERADEVDIVEIERRALKWYRTQDTNSPEIAAEIVYHLLRLSDIGGAVDAWRDGCGRFLLQAEETLPRKSSAWLTQRLGATMIEATSIDLWELDAAERVRVARSRGLDRVAAAVLAERSERGARSPLLFHDAYALRAQRQHEKALAVLQRFAISAPPPVARERHMLLALIHAEAGRVREADGMLARLDHDDLWKDRPEAELERAAVTAARVRLASDLAVERKVLSEIREMGTRKVQDWLLPTDALSPVLERALLGAPNSAETQWTLRLPRAPSEPGEFLAQLSRYRAQFETRYQFDWQSALFDVARDGQQSPLFASPPGFGMSPSTWAVLANSLFRWTVLAHGRLFAPLPSLLNSKTLLPLQAAVLGSQAVFVALRGITLEFVSDKSTTPLAIGPPVLSIVERNQGRWVDRKDYAELLGEEEEPKQFIVQSSANVLTNRRAQRALAIAFFRSAPEPLELLVDRFAGKPESSPTVSPEHRNA